MQITPQTLLDLNRQFNFDFQRGFQGRSRIWDKRAVQVPSSTFESVYGWLAELPEMRKWVGDRIVKNLVGRAYTLKNDPWELTIGVDRRAIEFDQIGQYSMRFAMMGESAAGWKDKLVTDAQIANGLCFDGQNFYDTDHPVNPDDSTAGVYINSYTSTLLTVDNFWTMCSNMMGFKGENGLPLEVTPTVLEVSPKLGKKGAEVLKAALYAQAVKNVAGAENVAAAAVNNPIPGLVDMTLVINPRFAGSHDDYWYIHSTNRLHPFLLQVVKDPAAPIALTNPNDHNVFWQREYIWGVDADGAAGYTLPFLSIRCKETA